MRGVKYNDFTLYYSLVYYDDSWYIDVRIAINYKEKRYSLKSTSTNWLDGNFYCYARIYAWRIKSY